MTNPCPPLDDHDYLACPVCTAYSKGGMSRFDLIVAHSPRAMRAAPFIGCLLGAIAGVYVGLTCP